MGPYSWSPYLGSESPKGENKYSHRYRFYKDVPVPTRFISINITIQEEDYLSVHKAFMGPLIEVIPIGLHRKAYVAPTTGQFLYPGV